MQRHPGWSGAGPGSSPDPWRHRYALFICAATLFLIFAGGMVTSTGSGLAVPDWPLSFGQFFPPMVGGVFYEHGHRMVAGTVGILTLVLALWTWGWEPRRWVRRLATAAVAAVVAQAVLGGLTVLFLLPDAISTAHAGLANLFFCILVTMAAVTGPWWISHEPGPRPAGADPSRPGLAGLAGAACGAIYVQILLGAITRHTGSGLAIPDFPLAFGRLIPPLDDPQVAIHFAHRVGALVVLCLVAAVVVRALRHYRADWDLLWPALLFGALTLAQITLGAYVIWTFKSVKLTTTHVMIGSATLGSGVLLTLRAARKRRAAGNRPAAGAATTGGRA